MNYTKLYNQIIYKNKYIKYDKTQYTENHHIIPKSLGGTDNKDNLVRLSAREHFICHLLLTKMYPEGSIEWIKMMKAFTMMMFRESDNQERYINSHWYSYWRENFSKPQSLSQSGCSNSNYGTCWIHNIETKEPKKIHKSELDNYLSNGYDIGRVPHRNILYDKKKKQIRKRTKEEIAEVIRQGHIKQQQLEKERKEKFGRKYCYINKITNRRKYFRECELSDVDLDIWEPTWVKFDVEEIKQLYNSGKNWSQIAEYYNTTYWSIYSWYLENKELFGIFFDDLKKKRYNIEYIKTCLICGKEFKTKNKHARTCSKSCSGKLANRRKR